MRRITSFIIGSMFILSVDAAVEPVDDNGRLTGDQRCAHAMIDYYQAIPMLANLASSGHLHFRTVRVAIIDEGLHRDSGQFDHLRSLHFLDPPRLLADERSHGTAVTSIIAADRNDGLINGIASRLLGDRLELIIGRAYYQRGDLPAGERARHPGIALDVLPTVLTIERVEQAIAAGANIINLSFGANTTDGSRIAHFSEHQRRWADVIRNHSDVLFIAAAANHPYELTGGNNIPAGLDAANLISVGGIESCRPLQHWSEGAYGDQIDIAAPSTVQAVYYDPTTRTAHDAPATGNSFATALVTSVAAIVQSIAPELRGATLKEFLLAPGNSYPTATEVSGRRLSMVKPTVRAILDYTTPPASVISLLDSFHSPDDFADPAGYIINRQFGSVVFNLTALMGRPFVGGPQVIDGHDIEFRAVRRVPDPSARSQNLGDIMPGITSFRLGNRSITATFGLIGEFLLNEDYTTGSKLASLLDANVAGTDRFIGEARRGHVRLTECEITSRALPLNWMTDPASGEISLDRFITIEVTGQVDVTYEGEIARTEPEPAAYRFEGDFTTAFFVVVATDAMVDAYERQCVGGIPGAHR